MRKQPRQGTGSAACCPYLKDRPNVRELGFLPLDLSPPPLSLANLISVPSAQELRQERLEVERRALKLKATLLLVCSPGNTHGGRAAGQN